MRVLALTATGCFPLTFNRLCLRDPAQFSLTVMQHFPKPHASFTLTSTPVFLFNQTITFKWTERHQGANRSESAALIPPPQGAQIDGIWLLLPDGSGLKLTTNTINDFASSDINNTSVLLRELLQTFYPLAQQNSCCFLSIWAVVSPPASQNKPIKAVFKLCNIQ